MIEADLASVSLLTFLTLVSRSWIPTVTETSSAAFLDSPVPETVMRGGRLSLHLAMLATESRSTTERINCILAIWRDEDK